MLPEPFTRERLDGKIPVKTDLIREQVRKELDGIPEAEAERWQVIETDYNRCRLSSARATKSEAEQVFSVCMSERGYVYMNRIEAEELHDSIADKVYEERQAAARRDARRAEEERQIAARWAEEQRQNAIRRAEEERQAAEEAKRKAEEQRQAAEIAKHIKSKTLEWVLAINEKNLNKMWALGAQNVDTNAAGIDGITALHLATKENDIEFIRALIAAGADVNSVAKDVDFNPNSRRFSGTGGITITYFGETPLYLAAEEGHTEIAKILIAAGADVNAKRVRDGVVLDGIIRRGYAEDTHILYSYAPLDGAAEEGHAEVVKALIVAGTDVNATDGRRMALHVAASGGHAEVVRILIAAGADVNARDGIALDAAARFGHAEVVRILIAAGANVHAAHGFFGGTGLHVAAEEGHAEVAKILIAAGEDVNAKDDFGMTALHAAAEEGQSEVAKILIAAGADVNAVDNGDNTTLNWAAGKGQSEVAKILIAAGADVNAVDNDGDTALHVAAHNEHAEVVKVLIAAGTNLNANNNNGETALDYAARFGHAEVIRILKAAGAE